MDIDGIIIVEVLVQEPMNESMIKSYHVKMKLITQTHFQNGFLAEYNSLCLKTAVKLTSSNLKGNCTFLKIKLIA